MNIRDKEAQALSKMLSLSSSSGSGKNDSNNDYLDQWKVLIYDHDCRDIISPLMNIGTLRQKGVTLHMMLHSDREAIPDAPAVYFVRPTEANLKRVAEDCAKQLYRTAYINFSTRIERPLLEKFANDLVSTNSVNTVSKIFDQYIDLVALEPALFTLNIPDSFKAYNDPKYGESEIKHYISKLSSGLLSLVRITGALPIIRSSQSGPAFMLASDLCNTLRENISARGAAQPLFGDCLISDHVRPLLLIFDRTADMSTPLMHTSTYQALIDDLLDHKLNRVTLEIAAGKDTANSASKKKTYDLNTQTDPFFSRFSGSSFPVVVEANEKELGEVSQREQEIRSKPQSMIRDSNSNADGIELSEAIESLPEILTKKANLEAHTNILHAVMKQIASREVPTYFELEQSIVNAGRIVDKPAVIALLKDHTKGNTADKARLLSLVAIVNEGSTLEYETAFSQGCVGTSTNASPSQEDISKMLSAAAFLKRLQSLQQPMSVSLQKFTSSTNQQNAMLSSFLTSAQSAMAKAASLFTKFAPVYVTRVVDAISEGRSCTEDDTFCTFDPRLSKDVNNSGIDSKGQRYSDVIVFIIGGGCYTEYYNLQDLLKQKTSGSNLKNITYGCSELLNGESFLSQCCNI